LAFLSMQIYVYSFSTCSLPADVAIVLGAAVWDGHPSPVFEERIRHAINLYEGKSVQVIIFTGGVGEGDQVAESEVAKEYAILHGVAVEHIFCETSSKITYENLREAKGILGQQGLTTALIVSDPLHMRRAMTIARDLGIDAYPSPTRTSRYKTWKSKLRFLLRETYFYATYLLRRPLAISRVEPSMLRFSKAGSPTKKHGSLGRETRRQLDDNGCSCPTACRPPTPP
jgi:uncharacterized SAM-binding protein YcdF (DUF218 family)